MRFIKHDTLINIYINDIRKYIMSLIDFTVADNNLVRFRINDIS